MNITFLFGSGADTDACSKLKSGQSFSEALLSEKYMNEVNCLLGRNFSSFQLVYSRSTKVFIQTVNTYAKEAKGILEDADIENFQKYYADKKSISYSEIIRPKCLEYYQKLRSDNSSDKAIKEYFLKYAVFFDALDEKFNSLRYSELNDNARRVMNAYTTIFVLMVKSLYAQKRIEWKYEKVFETLKRDYDIEPASDSYYQMLKKANIDCSIVTTNYTNLVEKETNQDVTYLHGKLTWFEDLCNLSVYDCKIEEERKHLLKAKRIMPFILIPSGVKPLICTKQIKQFSDFIDKLEKSNELCIVGYRFNSEDNHINSIIADWLRKANHRLVYFNYNDDVDFAAFEWTQEFSVNHVIFSEKTMGKLTFDKIQNISVVGENCKQAFSDYLKIASKEG